MPSKTPEEVLRAISADFKTKGITHASAASRLGLKSAQTISNLLSSKKYLSKTQAIRFRDAFGYNEEFLTNGTGDLIAFESFEIARAWTRGSLTSTSNLTPGQIALILYWIQELLSLIDNEYAQEIMSSIHSFVRANETAKASLADYQGDDYEKALKSRVYLYESMAIDNIHHILDKMRGEIG